MFSDGKVLLIANPAAQIGNSATAAHRAFELLKAKLGEDRVALALTERKGHATEIASSLEGGIGTVVGLGGDGLMHEVANGLMKLPVNERPAFGVLPVGSGNDYAASLHMSTDLERAIGELSSYPTLLTDIGQCNGEYFLETLSFGVDAAIALGTEERRRRTGLVGTRLYLEEGLDKMLHYRIPRAFRLSMEDGCRVVYQGKRIVEESERVFVVEGTMLLTTFQIGPTYGGGFHITPDARLDDGVLDICVANAPLGAAKATYIFLRAQKGNHTGFNCLDFYRASKMTFELDEEAPIQIDGERLVGTHFDISVCPRALSVIRKA